MNVNRESGGLDRCGHNRHPTTPYADSGGIDLVEHVRLDSIGRNAGTPKLGHVIGEGDRSSGMYLDGSLTEPNPFPSGVFGFRFRSCRRG
jgi:hypothetical protein